MADEPLEMPDYPPSDESGNVDLWQIQEALNWTPTERIRRHDEFRAFLRSVRTAFLKQHEPKP